MTDLRSDLDERQVRKSELAERRDESAQALATARAELAGTEREMQAFTRDREARARAAKNRHGLPTALDKVAAEPGYERALAAALGRDAKATLGAPQGDAEGRFWTGAEAPSPVADSLAAHVRDCPAELAARLALVHVVDAEDGRALGPGEWLVTRGGKLRRWDGFVARGEGAAEAARLEADNRFAELEKVFPGLRDAAERSATAEAETREALSAVQREIVAAERDLASAGEQERQALRALDQAEAARERVASRRQELAANVDDIADQRRIAEADHEAAMERLATLPEPETGRARLEVAKARNEAAREAMQAAAAALAAHEQALAVARERAAGQQADMRNWQARAGEAARRLSGMTQRFEEIEEERAVVAAKPAGLLREIESAEAIRERIADGLAQAEAAVQAAGEAASVADDALTDANEALALGRETRAGLAARAESEEARREELARSCGERFHCPPPLLAGRFEFEREDIADAAHETAQMERLVAERERIGPVNLVAADELARIEEEHGTSAAEQAELAEAVARLRGSIGSLNREGRERLRAAFEAVDGHFRRLFTRLFEGGQAHLALIDSDDPLEAGLEIYAQPPGKRLQSLTLLSGGEQALTAIALIFALFLTNPAPICVLDEVDAPLDDANIDRFCDLLDAMNRETKTRYLIVTHNAVTMSRMHRLFGVTMVEKGVSRLVSVDLGGAEELLAAE